MPQGRATERVWPKSSDSAGPVTRRLFPPSHRLFIPQNLSDLAWAMADRGHKDEVLFRLIAQRAASDIQHFGKVMTVFGGG